MNETPQDALYQQFVAEHGDAVQRLVRAYEANPSRQPDLLQDIHIALWESASRFEGRCSVRTWVYRVAHNTAISYVSRERRRNAGWLSLEEAEATMPSQSVLTANDSIDVGRLMALVQRLQPFDRQLMILYLEDLDSNSIAEIAGISAGNVRVQIHRIKKLLSRQLQTGRSS